MRKMTSWLVLVAVMVVVLAVAGVAPGSVLGRLLSASMVDSGVLVLRFDPAGPAASSSVPLSILDARGRPVVAGPARPLAGNQLLVPVRVALLNTPLQVRCGDVTVRADKGWQLLDGLYAYDGDDLGCTLVGGQAVFKLWAPVATAVDLVLFRGDAPAVEVGRRPMVRGARGVWSGSAAAQGMYYQYEVTNPGREPRRVLDPYARSMAPVTVNSAGDSAGSGGDFVGKGAVVDLAATGSVAPFAGVPGCERRGDVVIWEAHVRDFTADPALAGSLTARWGTFDAFVEKLPYLTSLGVTHVQLLPVNAWYFGDETRMGQREPTYSTSNNEYNWGYDPHNYFSIDGAYSARPEDPALRVVEFKRLVDAVHRAGMGVILDVVYTHMATASLLDDIVPGYYFFRDAAGAAVGDFGCNLATNRAMAEKLMVDSVRHWFAEYGIDGMRFDMMGDATRDAVQRAFDAAKAINPRVVFLGEGWRTFKGHLDTPALAGQSADQDWMACTDDVGVFSDEFRNELKSGFGCEGQPRFLTGGARDVAGLFAAIKGQPSNTPADAPADMVQYIEAHDNLPLYDVIAQSIKKDPETAANDREIHRRIRLGNLLVLTSQGTAFLHAGQEHGRTKQWLAEGRPQSKYHELVDLRGAPFRHPYFIHDSYDSSDAVNRFDWSKATDGRRFPENVKTRDYTRGLIAVRRSSDAFRLPTRRLVDRNVRLLRPPEAAAQDLVLAWTCRATDGTVFYVFVNADGRSRTLTLPRDLRSGTVVADGERVEVGGLATWTGFELTARSITLDSLTAAIVRVGRR